jgi:hypothetical protein
MTERPDIPRSSCEKDPVRIVSWMGGEHWYIGEIQFLHLEDAISACERHGLEYQIIRDPKHLYKHEGD